MNGLRSNYLRLHRPLEGFFAALSDDGLQSWKATLVLTVATGLLLVDGAAWAALSGVKGLFGGSTPRTVALVTVVACASNWALTSSGRSQSAAHSSHLASAGLIVASTLLGVVLLTIGTMVSVYYAGQLGIHLSPQNVCEIQDEATIGDVAQKYGFVGAITLKKQLEDEGCPNVYLAEYVIGKFLSTNAARTARETGRPEYVVVSLGLAMIQASQNKCQKRQCVITSAEFDDALRAAENRKKGLKSVNRGPA